MSFRASLTALLLMLAVSIVVQFAFSAPETHTITIEGMKFTPEALEVHPGDSIVWVNKDIFPHTATSADKKTFDSGVIEAGKSWKHVIEKKGKFAYSCTLHPPMKATVVVK